MPDAIKIRADVDVIKDGAGLARPGWAGTRA